MSLYCSAYSGKALDKVNLSFVQVEITESGRKNIGAFYTASVYMQPAAMAVIEKNPKQHSKTDKASSV